MADKYVKAVPVYTSPAWPSFLGTGTSADPYQDDSYAGGTHPLIQTAITAAGSGFTVFLGEAAAVVHKFKPTAQIDLSSGVSLKSWRAATGFARAYLHPLYLEPKLTCYALIDFRLVTADAISANDANNITLDGLELAFSPNNIVLFQGQPLLSTGLIIKKCYFHNCAQARARWTDGLLIENCAFDDVQSSDGHWLYIAQNTKNAIVQDCYFGTNPDSVALYGSAYPQKASDLHLNPSQGAAYLGNDCIVRRNVFDPRGLFRVAQDGGTHAIASSNYVMDVQSSDDAIVENNLFIGGRIDIGIDGGGKSTCNRTIFRNNTFVRWGETGLNNKYNCVWIDTSAVHDTYIFNNIFVSPATSYYLTSIPSAPLPCIVDQGTNTHLAANNGGNIFRTYSEANMDAIFQNGWSVGDFRISDHVSSAAFNAGLGTYAPAGSPPPPSKPSATQDQVLKLRPNESGGYSTGCFEHYIPIDEIPQPWPWPM